MFCYGLKRNKVVNRLFQWCISSFMDFVTVYAKIPGVLCCKKTAGFKPAVFDITG